MVGNENRDPNDSPQARVDKIFDLMDEVRLPICVATGIRTRTTLERTFMPIFKDGNGELTKEEFMEGAAMDDSIVGALSMYQNLI